MTGAFSRSLKWGSMAGRSNGLVNQVAFALSSDCISWSDLGKAGRITGGWKLEKLNLPRGELVYIRARCSYSSGIFTGSGSAVEATQQIYITSKCFIGRCLYRQSREGINHTTLYFSVSP